MTNLLGPKVMLNERATLAILGCIVGGVSILMLTFSALALP